MDFELDGRRIDAADLPVGEYALPGPLRDALVAAILSGDKVATSSLAEQYRREGEPLPAVGHLEAVVDSTGRIVCVTRNVGVAVVPLGRVELAHAIAEGEGFEAVAQWRSAHERFWGTEEFQDACPVVIDDSTEVVCVRFEVVHRM